MKSRDIPCPLENDPDNFKLGKVSITLNVMVIFIIIIVKVAYIVAENKRRCEINLDLLAKFYIDLDIVTNHATDKLPSDAYVDPNWRTANMSSIEERGSCYAYCQFIYQTIQRKWYYLFLIL